MTTPLIVTGSTPSGVSVTIFGEIHNHIDPSFYHSLDLTNHTVWVEHSTQLSVLQPHQIPLFAEARGSEWIWFTCTRDKKQVQCIDTRLEHGFMSGIQERFIYNAIDRMDDPEIEPMVVSTLMQETVKLVQTVMNIKPMLEPIWSDVKQVLVQLKRESATLVRLAPIPYRSEDQSIALYTACVDLHDHLIQAASMSIDANLLQMIKTYDEKKPIYLFVGLNHAIRLAHWLKWDIHPHPTIDVESFRPKALRHIASREGRKRRVKKRP